MNINRKIYLLCDKAVQILRDRAPYKSGNLSNHGIMYTSKGAHGTTFKIWVDGNGKEGKAFYMPFTNEKWESPRWNGKENPNEQWWNRACEEIIEMFARELGGELTQNDTTKAISKPT